MWGMVEANATPPPVHPKSLEVFTRLFDNNEQVKLAVENAASAQLLAHSKILTLQQGRSGAIKLGRGMLGLDDFSINVIHSHLARLGIYLWGPDLTESAEALYNIACRLAALKSFWEVLLNGPYPNVDKKYLNNMTLITLAYNHFVHYLSAQRFKTETMSPGKFQLTAMRAVTLRRKHRASNCRPILFFLFLS